MSKSRQKGTAFETAVVRFLRGLGFDVDRHPLRGVHDEGDIKGLPQWCLELKAERQYDLAGYMAEAEREAAVGRKRWYAAVVKRRYKSVADAYVVMPLHVFADFLKEHS